MNKQMEKYKAIVRGIRTSPEEDKKCWNVTLTIGNTQLRTRSFINKEFAKNDFTKFCDALRIDRGKWEFEENSEERNE